MASLLIQIQIFVKSLSVLLLKSLQALNVAAPQENMLQILDVNIAHKIV